MLEEQGPSAVWAARARAAGCTWLKATCATSLTVTNSTITLNQAIGGVGGAAGGTGGAGEGGGLFNSPAGDSGPATLSISNSAILANAAEGGAGGTGGDGGDGLGGGIFNDQGATATVTTSVISANLAQGGLAGSGGSVGQGIGGGIYNLGTFSLDTLSVVIGNFASTSNDNKFGV